MLITHYWHVSVRVYLEDISIWIGWVSKKDPPSSMWADIIQPIPQLNKQAEEGEILPLFFCWAIHLLALDIGVPVFLGLRTLILHSCSLLHNAGPKLLALEFCHPLSTLVLQIWDRKSLAFGPTIFCEPIPMINPLFPSLSYLWYLPLCVGRFYI
jgi:hypothetical protein